MIPNRRIRGDDMSRNKNMWHDLIENVKYPIYAILLSFIIGSVFVIWAGESPLVAYAELFGGSLSGIPIIGETLLKTTPLIFTGLSIAFAFRAGLFNIGAEGQYVMGGLFTVIAGWVFRDLPGPLLMVAIIVSGALGGAFWAAIPGYLKAKRGIHEVIVTIMMNYIALFITNYFVRTILNPNTLLGTELKSYTVEIPEKARLAQFSDIIPAFGSSSLHTGILLAIVCAFAMWFILFKTSMGYEIRSVGNNPYAAEYGGISIQKNIILSMVFSGALAGLAGATTVAGLSYKVDQSSHSPGYGFTGIAVALVGKNHPIGVLASAFLFGILANGARKMEVAGIPKEIVGIIQGIIIIFIAGDAILKYFPELRKKIFKTKNKEVA